MFSRNSNIPPRRGILTASNQNRPVNSENENNAKQSIKDANTKTSAQTTRLKSATTTNTNVFQKRRSVLNDVSNAKSQQKPNSENEKAAVNATEITKIVRTEIKHEKKVTEIIKEEQLKDKNGEEVVHAVPVRPIILPAHLKKSQHALKDENKELQSIRLGKRSRSFFSDISNHISTHEMSEDIQEATVADLEEEKRALKVATQQWTDLDAEDKNDPMMVTEYVNEIFEYMRVLELETLPQANYMESQKELVWKMRGILVDWLMEVHCNFGLLPETLFLAVNIIDRFLSARVVSLVKLQLVGVTALFIASKYEEVMAPSIKNFTFMADGSLKDADILKAERYVLQVLDFQLCYPNPMHFLRRASKADNYDIYTRTVAKYFMEIPLVDHRFMGCPPSLISASALFLAKKMLSRGDWDANLVHYSGYKETQLRKWAELMLDYLAQEPIHDAFYKKYASKKFMKASIFVRDWMVKHYINRSAD